MGLLAKYYRLGQATGVNIHINTNGSQEMAVCGISLAGGQLNFERKKTGLKTIAQLKPHVSSNMPVSLNITGKGVLIKTFQHSAPEFSTLLPNASAADFYIQAFQSGDNGFVSLIRRADADKLIAEIENLGVKVLSLSLGPFAINNILPQLNFYGSPVVFDGHNIDFNEDGKWASYTYKAGETARFEIKAENEILNEGVVLPYAAAFQLLLADNVTPINADAGPVAKKHTDALLLQRLKVQSVALLAATFVLLLVNFLVFMALESKNTALAQQIGQSQQSYQDVAGLAEKIQQQKQLLKLLGWDGKFSKAVLVDSIARCVPRELTMTALEVQPFAPRPGTAGSGAALLPNAIRLSAYSKSVLPVNEWVERLKLQRWAKSVRIENYWFDAEANNARVIIMLTY